MKLALSLGKAGKYSVHYFNRGGGMVRRLIEMPSKGEVEQRLMLADRDASFDVKMPEAVELFYANVAEECGGTAVSPERIVEILNHCIDQSEALGTEMTVLRQRLPRYVETLVDDEALQAETLRLLQG